MKKIITILSTLIIGVVLGINVYAINPTDVSSVSTKNNKIEQSVEYNDDTLLTAVNETKTNIVEENSMQDAYNINKKNEDKEMVFVLGGVLLAFTVAAIYEINHD